MTENIGGRLSAKEDGTIIQQNNIDGRGTFTSALREALATALSDEDLVRHQGLALVRN